MLSTLSPACLILDTLHLNSLKHMPLQDSKDLCLSTLPLHPLSLVKLHNAWPNKEFKLKPWTLATEELRRHLLPTSHPRWSMATMVSSWATPRTCIARVIL